MKPILRFVLAMLLVHQGHAAKPNIPILVADDMSFSDVACYGGEIAMPNLDALAAAGLHLAQFFNTGRCWPSHAAILTGDYAQQMRRDTVPGMKSGAQGTRPAWAPRACPPQR